jgi:hypothetical protein
VELDPARFHALARAVAAPWRALWPDAVPSEALVAATRYSHLDAAYAQAGAGRSAHPELVGGWWPFLVAAVAFYGLLPRALLLAAARVRAARLLARFPLDDAEVGRVLARLASPAVDTRAAREERAGMLPSARDGAGPRALAEGPSALVLWRDVPDGAPLETAVARALGRPVVVAGRAGGRDHGRDRRHFGELAAGAAPVVVVAEAFEPPDRAARRLLGELRAALGPGRLLLVLLVGAGDGGPIPPRDEDVRVWRDALSALEDPHLGVEPLGEAP